MFFYLKENHIIGGIIWYSWSSYALEQTFFKKKTTQNPCHEIFQVEQKSSGRSNYTVSETNILE